MRLRRSDLVSWALIATVVPVGAYVLVIDRGSATTGEQVARAGMLLRVWRADDVTRVTFDRAGEHVEIVRDGDDWKMTSPRVAKADFLAVTALLNALGGARAERSVGTPNADDRAKFGLAAPRVKLEVSMKGVVLDLALGDSIAGAADAGAAGDSYLEVAPYGDSPGGVFVVSAEVARAIDRGADAYREPSLLGSSASPNYARIAIHAGGNALVLDRGAHGSWRIPEGVPGAPVRADADAVNALFSTFAELKADPFVDDATPIDVDHGGTIDLDLKSGGAVKVAFGGACPVKSPSGANLVVVQTRAPSTSTGCVPSFVIDRLTARAVEYVDLHPFALLFGPESAKLSEIEAVTIEREGKKIVEAERRADGLHLRVPDDEQVDKATSDRFLHRVALVAGTLVPPPIDAEKLGLASPIGKVAIKRRVDAMTSGANASEVWEQTISVGAPIDGAVYVRRDDDTAVIKLSLEDARAFGAEAAFDLRSPNLLDVSADSIVRIATAGPRAIVPYVATRAGSVTKLESPAGLGSDAAAMNELARQLSTLTCARWAADHDDGTFGFATPAATLDVERKVVPAIGDAAAPPSTFTLDFGAATNDGGLYVRVRGRDPVCVLPDARLEALLRPPIDRAAVAIDPTDAPKVVVTHGATTRTLTFDAATKLWRSGDANAASDVNARALADLIVALRAEGVVHLGASKPEDGLASPTLTIAGFSGEKKARAISFGAIGKLGSAEIYFARVDGIDATYGVLRADVDRVITAM